MQLSLADYLDTVASAPAVVYFSAAWCGPCKRIAPTFQALMDSAPEFVQFIKIDVDQSHDIAKHENISSMPTFLFYRNGHIISSFSGANVKELHDNFNALIALDVQELEPPATELPVEGSTA